jgi:NodT family efflux transporter outer membrane factor (OMF) lipoprotein
VGACAFATLLAGCAVGPDFKIPAAPAVTGYQAAPPTMTVATPGVVGGVAQTFAYGGEVAGDWWTLFHSAALDALIDKSLAGNPDLAAARAALKAANETTRAARGVYAPSVDAGLAASRQKDVDGRYSVFTPQLTVGFAPDVFGLNRRTVEGVRAQAEATGYEAAAARITLESNVAAGAIQLASLQAQVDATRRLVAINDDLLETLTYQRSKGYASPLDLAAQEAQAAQTAATLPPLLKALAQQRNLLSVLTGEPPGQGAPAEFTLSSLTLPQDLPVSLPSTLVAQRPDVLQAQANLHVASAAVGVAMASRLPNIQLTGNATSSAAKIGDIFAKGGGAFGLEADLAAPIFHGASLLHSQRAAQAGYAQAAEQYRSTVLVALQNVADTLAALEQDAATLQATARAANAAKASLDISTRQQKAGYASGLDLLAAQQAYQEAAIALVQAQADRYLDTVALYQALGGGWWRQAADLAPASAKGD